MTGHEIFGFPADGRPDGAMLAAYGRDGYLHFRRAVDATARRALIDRSAALIDGFDADDTRRSVFRASGDQGTPAT